MKFHELSFFQLSVAICCLEELAGPELRQKLIDAGFPGISANPLFYQKIKRCVDQGIVQITQEAKGQVPFKYRTPRKIANEVKRAMVFFANIFPEES